MLSLAYCGKESKNSIELDLDGRVELGCQTELDLDGRGCVMHRPNIYIIARVANSNDGAGALKTEFANQTSHSLDISFLNILVKYICVKYICIKCTCIAMNLLCG